MSASGEGPINRVLVFARNAVLICLITAFLMELALRAVGFSRPVFYELVELGVEETVAGDTQFGVWSGGTFFRLGDPGDE